MENVPGRSRHSLTRPAGRLECINYPERRRCTAPTRPRQWCCARCDSARPTASCTSTRPPADASARSPRAYAARARASVRGSSRSAMSRSSCTRGAGELHTVSGVDTARDAPRGPRAAGAGPHRERERRGAAEDVRRGRPVAARVRRALPAARRARRLRAGAAATSLSIRCCWPSSSSCTGWRGSPRASRPAPPAPAEDVPLVRFSAAAGGAVCGGCPGAVSAAAGRTRGARRAPPARRSPSCPSSPPASPPPLPAAPPISMPSTAASACARWR